MGWRALRVRGPSLRFARIVVLAYYVVVTVDCQFLGGWRLYLWFLMAPVIVFYLSWSGDDAQREPGRSGVKADAKDERWKRGATFAIASVVAVALVVAHFVHEARNGEPVSVVRVVTTALVFIAFQGIMWRVILRTGREGGSAT